MDRDRILKSLRREILSSSALDAAVITRLENVRYLTGFTGSYGFIYLTRRQAWFVTDGRYREQAHAEIPHLAVKVESSPLAEVIIGISKKTGHRRIGFEPAHTSFDLYRQMRKGGLLPQPLELAVESLREIKEPYEVRSIRQAVRKAEAAFLEILPMIRPGRTEAEVAAALECSLRRHGSARLPFPAIVASGRRSALPHARPTSRKVRKGDLLVIDWGGEHDGYFSDMTRTFMVGGGGGEKRKLCDIVLAAQRAAIGAVRPAIPLRAVDQAARDKIAAEGFGAFFNHGTGHGVGLEIHERPRVSNLGKGDVRAGMVFTVEPGIYVPELGGVRIEDMVLVTDAGAEKLTRLPVNFDLPTI